MTHKIASSERRPTLPSGSPLALHTNIPTVLPFIFLIHFLWLTLSSWKHITRNHCCCTAWCLVVIVMQSLVVVQMQSLWSPPAREIKPLEATFGVPGFLTWNLDFFSLFVITWHLALSSSLRCEPSQILATLFLDSSAPKCGRMFWKQGQKHVMLAWVGGGLHLIVSVLEQ